PAHGRPQLRCGNRQPLALPALSGLAALGLAAGRVAFFDPRFLPGTVISRDCPVTALLIRILLMDLSRLSGCVHTKLFAGRLASEAPQTRPGISRLQA